ncbi:MBL fold metallo-hydrolase [Advenella mimigardefordensis]|uniref:Beta-lactamase hydrolase-like protein n=1 Tax=Advenella mimigardefordensis (strain DSM 17166 / LMG 22922 / DPN7) TaxID=1247726 RepID=W0PCK9_ADVMD|nr:MBL fold metallo-hydrolase [Advenella mimigardefordensis]AHG64629.1 beta-lactamase hydrolase-like protein [Advenella mimigardefordensis DPN7]
MSLLSHDPACQKASQQIINTLHDPMRKPVVKSFFDEATNTISYVVHAPNDRHCAVIDSVLDYDAASGRTSAASVQPIIDYVRLHQLQVQWLLETHAHADHLSAAPILAAQLGGQLAIGKHIGLVQNTFAEIYNTQGSQSGKADDFDHLFDDGDTFTIGALQATVLHVPGHTPACLAYIIGDCVFVGDTLFMPDYGTARCDFPGGDARTLYQSIQRLLRLPGDARVLMCHDYKAPGRDEFVWETTIEMQRRQNIHVHEGVSEDEFVIMRTQRDATLSTPKLLLPSIQVNVRGGKLPEPEHNGVRYLKIPLNTI